MRLAFVTDLHLQEDPGTGRVKENQMAMLTEVVEDIKDAEIDIILLGGDNSGRSAPYKSSPAERNAHIWFRRQLAEFAPVVEVQGNHDYPGDYTLFNKLETRNTLVYEEHPGVMMGDAVLGPKHDCVIGLYPWIFESESGDEDHYNYCRDILDNLIETARLLRDEDEDEGTERPYILLGHCAIAGAMVRAGQPKVPTKDYTLDPEAFFPDHKGRPLFDVGFFGHYHLRQPIHHIDGKPVAVYGGSLFVSEYGEDIDKGWTLYDTKTQEFTFYQVEQPPKVEIVYSLEDDAVAATKPDLGIDGHGLEDIDFDELEVRLTIMIPEDGLEPYKARVEEIMAVIGKTAFELETRYRGTAKEPTRDGAKAIAEATSFEDKLCHYWNRTGSGVKLPEVAEAIKAFKKIKASVDARA